MCRLLYVRQNNEFEIKSQLEKLANIAKSSKEYQGDGWGCMYLQKGQWKYHHSTIPIWEDNPEYLESTNLLIAHARGASDSELKKSIFCNMPFYDGQYVFAFNGELLGVKKLGLTGRSGAEKIFKDIRIRDKENSLLDLKATNKVFKSRTKGKVAMNILMADKEHLYLSTTFNEDHDYYQMWKKEDDSRLIVCSDPSDSNEKGWKR